MNRSFTVVKSGLIAIALCGSLFFGVTNISSAATTPANNAALQAQIQMLLKLLVSLQAQLSALQAATQPSTVDGPLLFQYTNIDDGVGGTPTIVMTSNPTFNQTFNKDQANDPIKVSWEAHNVPPHTQVQVEIGNITPGPIGGGEWGSAIPVGDSRGVYPWVIHGIGLTSAGTYQVRVKLEECHPDGCNYNAHFPGREVPVKLYAVSPWRPFRVIGSNDPVTWSVPVPTVAIGASPLSVVSGNSSVITWSTTNAQRCVLQHSNEEEVIPTNGSKTITPSEKETYTIWCANDAGDGKDGPSASANVTVNVTPATSVHSCTITTDKSTYKVGDTIKVSWTSKNFTKPSLQDNNKAGGSFDVRASGSRNFTVEYADSYYGYNFSLSDNYSGYSQDFKPTCSVRVPTTLATGQFQTAIAVGAYEGTYPAGVTHSAGNHPRGQVTVYLPDSSYGDKSMVLVLTAYEPVDWNITGPGAHLIGSVVHAGYYEQRVTGLSAAIPLDWAGNMYAYKASDPGYAKLESIVEEKYGTTIQQFIGQYTQKTVTFVGYKG